MKAKKLIAVGLAAAMTVGMTISAFATTYDKYSDVPQFAEENWEQPFGVNDDAFHAKGQGWLESGKGINESATNVIVPTMPALAIRYGQPGLYDFGFDPQRLVYRTDARKYTGKENFTLDAKNSGVYFINGDLDESDEIRLNTYDNKSVKLQGTNIGSEDVAFTVIATLKGGDSSFKYLDEYPAATAADSLNTLWETLGDTWTDYVTEHQMYTPDAVAQRPLYLFARYLMNIEENDPAFTSAQMKLIKRFATTEFVNDEGEEAIEAARLLYTIIGGTQEIESDAQLIEALESYDLIYASDLSDSDIGMYLGLNTSLGNTTYEGNDRQYEETAYETPLIAANVSKIPEAVNAAAAAKSSVIVKGSPDNYATTYDEGLKDYTYALKDREYREPFQTVAFWFRGVATANASVSITEIPALDFTWSFTKDKDKFPKEPVEAPKLTAINGNAVPAGFNGEFTIADCVDGGIALTFDHEVDRIERINGENWVTVPEETVREITGNTVTFKQSYIEIMSADRTFRVVCTEGYSDSEPGYSNSFIIKKLAD